MIIKTLDVSVTSTSTLRKRAAVIYDGVAVYANNLNIDLGNLFISVLVTAGLVVLATLIVLLLWWAYVAFKTATAREQRKAWRYWNRYFQLYIAGESSRVGAADLDMID